jgi:hypothetical protein
MTYNGKDDSISYLTFTDCWQEVGSGRMMSIGYPLWLLTFLTANIVLVYYCFQDQALWNT